MKSVSVPAALRRPDAVPLDQRVCWSLADASRATTLSVRKLQQMIAAKELAVRKVGRRVLLDPAAVKTAIFGSQTVEG